MSQKKMAGTKTGARAQLECGHTVIIFGDQRHIDGKVLCLKCYADRQ